MKKHLRLLIMSIACSVGILQLSAQVQYSNYSAMSQKIAALSKEYPALCTVKSLVKTAGGKEIWVMTIGTGDKDNKPGIAVFGGVEGSHILGKELTLGFASELLKGSASEETKKLLEKVTFYVFPDVSPDATEQYFSALKYERNVNARSTDDDRDFATDEDPYEDLNKDGMITMIRVSDPSGKYTESSEDKRILAIADLSKGETGKYLLYSEGIDNDKDDNFNEDGAGGVAFNKNFSFNFEEYGLNSGLHAVSEPETKAVADFLFDKFNIYTVITFGPQDNLGQPLKASERQMSLSTPGMGGGRGTGGGGGAGGGGGTGMAPETGDRRITAILRSDETVNKLVSDKYHEITGAKGAPVTRTTQGNFMEWAYFHYGRYSFSTPAWWFPAERGKSAEAAFLKFAAKNKIADPFVPWTEITHPDFPGKKTEVGGIKPFVMINPPADTLASLIEKNYKFVTAVAAMHPELEFLDIKTENAGENIYRVSLKLHNKGLFATNAEIGEISTWTRILRISLEPASGQSFLNGRKVQNVSRIEGGQFREFSWLINGKGNLKVTAGALNTGTVTATIELK
jgi:hypothetical protein